MLPTIKISKVDTQTFTTTALDLQPVGHACRFGSRLRGLLGRPPLAARDGLLLSPCAQVHTFGMRYTLDVVHLDKYGKILKCVPALLPNRLSGASQAKHTLELAHGSIARQGLAVGDRLVWEAL
jgi:uncharacterized membrane protein (UPF0127 family)